MISIKRCLVLVQFSPSVPVIPPYITDKFSPRVPECPSSRTPYIPDSDEFSHVLNENLKNTFPPRHDVTLQIHDHLENQVLSIK